MPKVSVIIPVYNVEKYIERCARSLFEQTLDDIEYVFVNDCTPDNSMQVLREVVRAYPNRASQLKIINHSINTGQSGARQDGIRAASGDYIIHCDADDWVDVDMYESMYLKMIESGADAVCCDMAMEYNGFTKYLIYNSEFEDHRLMIDGIAPISVEYFSLCNRLVARHIYDQHKITPFPDINIWEDVGISTRIRYYCGKCVVINKPFYHYNRQNEESTSRLPNAIAVPNMCACAKALEGFFIEEGVIQAYQRFVSIVKLVAKAPYIHVDQDMWRKTFPETRMYIYFLKQFSRKSRLLMMLLAYLGKMGGRLYVYIERFLRIVGRRSIN